VEFPETTKLKYQKNSLRKQEANAAHTASLAGGR
jgi:hypothetical protein